MAPKKSQADRKAAKKGTKDLDEAPPPSGVTMASLGTRMLSLMVGSCAVQVMPKLQTILQAPPGAAKKEEPKKEEEKTEEKEETEGEVSDSAEAKPMSDDAGEIFATLQNRMVWYNVLGLAEPLTGEQAKDAFLEMKGMELDYGPKAKKGRSVQLDRILVNMDALLPQYLHILLALMMLRAFLFRSFFACLPWLVGYQVASLLLPLTALPQLPQVPLEKVEVKFRVAATMGIHALVWLFFLYEVLWKCWFFEKIPLVGLFAYHAFAVRPKGA